MDEHAYDVVVVGLGAGGLAAAITAHDAGASVVVVEKGSVEGAGGSSRVSGGVWFSPVDVGLAEEHLQALSMGYPVPPDVARAWAAETAHTTEWISARMAETKDSVEIHPFDHLPRDQRGITSMHFGALVRSVWPDTPDWEWPDVHGNECGVEWNFIGDMPGFSRLWLTLRASLQLRGIPVIYETRAVRLLNEDGVVTGVEGEHSSGAVTSFRAHRGVVVATGGFANNQDMVRNYLRLSYATAQGSPANTGDGIRMAQKVGADLAHPTNFMGQPGIAMPPYETGAPAVPGEGRFINVTADGRRFINEWAPPLHGKAHLRGDKDGYEIYPGFPMWTIFDEDGRLAGPLVASRGMTWVMLMEGYEWSPDNSAEVERGWITRADTIRELAIALGIDPDGLQQEVAEYNAAAERGIGDARWGRSAESMHPIIRGPFYGYRWAQLLITTLGGIRKDGHGRALDPEGMPIPGLYCAGDVASSYSWLLGGGMGLSDALAFGRLAVRHALGGDRQTRSEREEPGR